MTIPAHQVQFVQSFGLDGTKYHYLLESSYQEEGPSQLIELPQEGNLSCIVCTFKTKKRKLLMRHIQRMHFEKKHQCNKCTKEYRYQSELKKHVIDVHEKITLQCDECDKLYTNKYHLNAHKISHHGKYTPHKCPETGCDRKFTRPDYLKDHINTHNNLKPYTCNTCEKKFASRVNHRNHVKRCMPQKAVKCDECGKSFKTIQYLKQHASLHNGKLHPCDKCGKLYRWKTRMYVHKKNCSGKA